MNDTAAATLERTSGSAPAATDAWGTPKGVLFITPTIIEVKAFTVSGLSVKTGSNPIGRFGTGLKYAIAVMVRHSLKVRLFIDGVEYEFYKKADTFRGETFDFVMMRRRNGPMRKWFATQLPFTVELGKHWKLWQAYRELYTNTVDEGGQVTEWMHGEKRDFEHLRGHTAIVVEGADFCKEHDNRSKTFLLDNDGDIMNRSLDDARFPIAAILPEPSKHIYWRGMRIYDLPEGMQSKYTYNIFRNVDLTEDRTAAFYMYDVLYPISDAVKSLGEQDERLIRNIVISKDKDLFESTLPFDQAFGIASDTFKRVVSTIHSRQPSRLSSHAGLYYGSYIAPTLRADGEQAIARRIINNTNALLEAINGTDLGNAPQLLIESEEQREDLVASLRAGRSYYINKLPEDAPERKDEDYVPF